MDVIMTPIIGGTVVILLLFIIGAAVYFKRHGSPFAGGSKKSVLLLRDRDKRFKEILITNETDLSLQSTKSKGIVRHFIKSGGGWSDEARPRTLFLALEGYCKTLFLDGSASVKFTLKQALTSVWGPEVYGKMPAKQKEQVESAVFDITVEPLDPPKTPEGVYASNEARFSESDFRMIDYYSKKMKEQKKTDWMNVLLGFLAGVVLVYIAANARWIKFG